MTPSLTPEQGLRLSGTRAADAEGRPLVLHHGTLHRFDRFGRTRDIGYHFGSRAQAAARLGQLTREERSASGAGSPRIVSAALALHSPVVLPDDPVAWSGPHVADLFRRFLTRSERVDAEARRADGGVPVTEREAAVRAIVRAALLRAGHDGVVYRNVVERELRSGLEWSWIALDPDAVVILGEDLTAAAVPQAPGVAPVPGIEPAETVRALGGLRRRNFELARVADVRRLVELARESVARVAPDCTLSRKGTVDREDWAGAIPVGSGEIRIEIFGRAGRLRIRPPRQGGDTDALGDLAADGLISPVVGLPAGSYIHSGNWQPGEPVGTVVAEFEETLGAIVERLVADPTAPAPR